MRQSSTLNPNQPSRERKATVSKRISYAEEAQDGRQKSKSENASSSLAVPNDDRRDHRRTISQGNGQRLVPNDDGRRVSVSNRRESFSNDPNHNQRRSMLVRPDRMPEGLQSDDPYLDNQNVIQMARLSIIPGPIPSKRVADSPGGIRRTPTIMRRNIGKLDPAVKKRNCVDKGCAVFFLVCSLFAIAALYFGFSFADFKQLAHGTDSDGNLCGVKGVADLTDSKFLLTFNYTRKHSYSICVSKCPDPTTDPISCIKGLTPPTRAQFETENSQYQGYINNSECVKNVETVPIFNLCIPKLSNSSLILEQVLLRHLISKGKIVVLIL
jgi:hypothetical protein